MSTTAVETLNLGQAIVAGKVLPFGFIWRTGNSGASSGGAFASGEFVRSDRKLELNFRWSLGLVAYRLGSDSISHEEYMRALLGHSGGNQYPGFSNDPMDGFRHLAHDIEQYCSDFLNGTDHDFLAIVARARANSPRRGLP
jgi:hypothetical protein